MMTNVPLTVLFVIIINQLDYVQPDALSLSIAGMENLVSKETVLINNLELYLAALERKADVIRSNLQFMKAENEKALLEGDAYLMNPLQAFPLLRRMQSDWMHWELFLQKPVGENYIHQISSERQNLPSEEELNEGADAMFRLQDTYELHPAEMSVGKLNGVQYDVRLSAIDCFSIGYRLHGIGKYNEAGLWFESAMNLFNNKDTMNEVLDFDMGKILYFYAQALAKQDLLTNAVALLGQLIKIDPGNVNTIKQKQIWEMEIRARENFPQKPIQRRPLDVATLRYKFGCQGKFPERTPNLHCVYNDTNNAFLKLAPLKMELISLDPYMVLYHDVLSDFEIEMVKAMAKPKLSRATVYSEEQKKSIPISTRTSKFAWFPDNTNQVTLNINQRLEDMTGFNLHMSEHLQAMNYGIGGHYATHYDFFNVSLDNPVIQHSGNRIATAMFYLSDVKQGGSTVFPNVELAVRPKKGACIFWHNLNTRGDGDPNTLHAACPVIVGSKWVCNKWIREREQIFRRPCPRQSNDHLL